jgi:hypothetical protein
VGRSLIERRVQLSVMDNRGWRGLQPFRGQGLEHSRVWFRQHSEYPPLVRGGGADETDQIHTEVPFVERGMLFHRISETPKDDECAGRRFKYHA